MSVANLIACDSGNGECVGALRDGSAFEVDVPLILVEREPRREAATELESVVVIINVTIAIEGYAYTVKILLVQYGLIQ